MADFPDKAVIADLTARALLEVKAIHFRADEPFKLTSGRMSPVYIDCRKLISFPRLRNTLMDFAASTILRDIGFESLDGVVGGETAGIPFAAWIADRLSLPMQYVRKKPKGFGRNAQIEGHFRDGDRVILVEDLATDGGSKLTFCEALRSAGLQVNHTFVVFYYDIFPETKQVLTDAGVQLHALATWWDVLKFARTNNYFDTKTLDAVEAFLHNPKQWSLDHGGVETPKA
ncbi:orotate phosphoribosyltransferase [Faunimonas pinastri]|uniref:Orotate phosphoribosyltransferase n=1 Tax=Faunimonas pinastri TaxID=1855383 RepID=A0A1H9HVI3_9HYPH|nr:orotate phosphoribosyltransferase [Faunimonas pinastri]SEQ66359.1 orotate phosphoribosyltransferase [Faunimonas pinastri]